MLTLSNLKAFAEDLNIIKIELDELIKSRPIEALFTGSEEYYNALKACEYYPQDYFKIRIFDWRIELRFNNKNKQFFIAIESLNQINLHFYDLKVIIEKYNIETTARCNRLFIPYDTSFNNVVRIFCEFIIAFLRYYLKPDVLFSF